MDATIVIPESVAELQKELLIVSSILVNLRAKQSFWETNYGYDARKAKKYWEKKADDWINNHIVHNQNPSINERRNRLPKKV